MSPKQEDANGGVCEFHRKESSFLPEGMKCNNNLLFLSFEASVEGFKRGFECLSTHFKIAL